MQVGAPPAGTASRFGWSSSSARIAALVERAVGLRARRAHRRALARVEHAELDAGAIGGARHHAAERVDLPHQMALADAADGRIAAHLAERLDVLREQQRARAHARRRQRGLGAGVAAADDDHVKGVGVTHGGRIGSARGPRICRLPGSKTREQRRRLAGHEHGHGRVGGESPLCHQLPEALLLAVKAHVRLLLHGQQMRAQAGQAVFSNPGSSAASGSASSPPWTISLACRGGAIFGLLGPNGAGKSTTIKMLTTLLPPSSGTARGGGFDIVAQAADVRRRIGYVPQLVSADGGAHGAGEPGLSAKLYRIPRAERGRRIGEALTFMGLVEAAANQLVRTYSGGMIRRLELAQAMLHRPSVLFLDEPTIGLDPVARRAVWERLLELRRGVQA